MLRVCALIQKVTNTEKHAGANNMFSHTQDSIVLQLAYRRNV